MATAIGLWIAAVALIVTAFTVRGWAGRLLALTGAVATGALALGALRQREAAAPDAGARRAERSDTPADRAAVGGLGMLRKSRLRTHLRQVVADAAVDAASGVLALGSLDPTGWRLCAVWCGQRDLVLVPLHATTLRPSAPPMIYPNSAVTVRAVRRVSLPQLGPAVQLRAEGNDLRLWFPLIWRSEARAVLRALRKDPPR